MGYYGGTAEASMPPYDWTLLSDIDNTGIVNLGDYAYMSRIFNSEQVELDSDLNRDGRVDFEDIYILISDWLRQTSWE